MKGSFIFLFVFFIYLSYANFVQINQEYYYKLESSFSTHTIFENNLAKTTNTTDISIFVKSNEKNSAYLVLELFNIEQDMMDSIIFSREPFQIYKNKFIFILNDLNLFENRIDLKLMDFDENLKQKIQIDVVDFIPFGFKNIKRQVVLGEEIKIMPYDNIKNIPLENVRILVKYPNEEDMRSFHINKNGYFILNPQKIGTYEFYLDLQTQQMVRASVLVVQEQAMVDEKTKLIEDEQTNTILVILFLFGLLLSIFFIIFNYINGDVAKEERYKRDKKIQEIDDEEEYKTHFDEDMASQRDIDYRLHSEVKDKQKEDEIRKMTRDLIKKKMELLKKQKEEENN